VTRPRLRVGIVSWNTAELLDRCLAALPAALSTALSRTLAEPGLDAEVVVVDNASSDGSAEVAARHGDVRVIRNATNRGYARAMNQALATAAGTSDADVLIALNPDTEAPPGSLAALVERLLGDPGVGLVGPALVHPDGTRQHSAYRFPSLRQAAIVGLLPRAVLRRGLGRRWSLEGHGEPAAPCDVDWIIGAVHVMRASALEGRAPYSERWFMYVEDLDLCWRLAQGGWRRRLEADVTVTHVGNAAGAAAWGAQRRARWTAASYDWYAGQHGAAATRAWAALNLAGTARWWAQTAAGRGGAEAGGGPDRHELAGLVRVHARALVAGASPATERPDILAGQC
jgi:GT2 family glycosyltransferase